MQITCGVCHARQPLQACVEQEAGSELASMLAGMPRDLALPLMHYVGYFRPAKQQLGWGRAVRLMRETLALQPDQVVLAAALDEAARGLDEKRAAPGWRPLGNHNYLKRCLESAQARAPEPGNRTVPTDAPKQPAPNLAAVRAPSGRMAQALTSMEALKQ